MPRNVGSSLNSRYLLSGAEIDIYLTLEHEWRQRPPEGYSGGLQAEARDAESEVVSA